MLDVTVDGVQFNFGNRLEDGGAEFSPPTAQRPHASAPLEEHAVGGLELRLVERLGQELSYRREVGRSVVGLVPPIP